MRWRRGKQDKDSGGDTPHFDTGKLEEIRNSIDEKLKKKGLTKGERKDLLARRDEINRRFRDKED